MKLSLKPHHFLDIIKLYGFGLDFLVPDIRRGHGFSEAGNVILRNPQTVVSIVIGIDDICKPCRFAKDGKCTDKMRGFVYEAKEEWNRVIDRRILAELDLKEGDEVIAIDFCQLAQRRLTGKVIAKIWKERPASETGRRTKHLSTGLDKYLRKHSAAT